MPRTHALDSPNLVLSHPMSAPTSVCPAHPGWPTRGLAALLLSFTLTACTMQTETFDAPTWKAQRGASAVDNKRSGMVASLETAVHVGMPRAEVIQLLGEPDARQSNAETDVYMLGLAMGPDEQYYEIRYTDGKVAALRLGQY